MGDASAILSSSAQYYCKEGTYRGRKALAHSSAPLIIVEDGEKDDDVALSSLRLGEFFNTSIDLLTGVLPLKDSPTN